MDRNTIRGVTFAVLAAACFGVVTPVLASFQGGLPPFAVSGWISVGMLGASLVSATFGRNGPTIDRACLPRLAVSALLGAVFAPALLTFGLSRANGVAACLLLNFEAVFTALLGFLVYRERIGWRFALGLFAVTAGALVLMSDTSSSEEGVVGLLAVAGATALWATDNALNRPLARFDSSQVMFGKGLVGAAASLVCGLVQGGLDVQWQAVLAVVTCGLVGYGGMERFYLVAQRTLGVARTSSIFAVSPFFGAAIALFQGIPTSPSWVVAGILMAFGVALHATDADFSYDDGVPVPVPTAPPAPPRDAPGWR